jgi:hypothetical protein
MNYEQLKALGISIDRGALAGGFKDVEGYTHVSAHQGEGNNPEASRCKARPELEDLSALNPKYKGRDKNKGHAARWMAKFTKEELRAEMSRRAKMRDPRRAATKVWENR